MKDRKKDLSSWFTSLKVDKKCCRCEENHPACLEYHHRDAEEKVAAVATMMQRGMSRKRIMEEIAKCDLICSNCHRKLHWNQKHGLVVQSDRTAVS